jgi:type IV pilus assembly protein PilE
MELKTARGASGGFTLIELMVVVVIASILVAISVPLYKQQVMQSRRTDARTALLDLAGREERFLTTNPTGYTTAAANLGYGGFGVGNPVGQGYYYLNTPCVAAPNAALACDANANAPAGPAFYLTATYVPGTTQANDTNCATFAVDSTGAQFAFNSAGTLNTAYCWSN